MTATLIPIVGRTVERDPDELVAELRRQQTEGVNRYLDARDAYINRMAALQLGLADGTVVMFKGARDV